MNQTTHQILTAIFFFGIVSTFSFANADELVIKKKGVTTSINANIVAEASDGGLLARTADGKLWIIEKEELVSRELSAEAVEPLSETEMAKELLSDLPPGFRIYKTNNFVIAYQTERVYARWVGGLYERLYRGFKSFWKKKKFPIENRSEYPLTTVIFRSKAEYAEYVRKELGSDPGTMVAYYNLMTNRVAMYDLTADQQGGGQLQNDRRINQILSNPNVLPMVATVIHEATHQLMFNLGMQVRFSDTPLWLNEGLAMYFETPDLQSNRGWRAIGKVNYLRLVKFRQDFSSRQAGQLSQLIASDKIFHTEKSLSAYAESWALVYFLIEKHPRKFVDYLKYMSEKKPLDYDDEAGRLRDFKKFFGDDLGLLDREFIAFVRKLN